MGEANDEAPSVIGQFTAAHKAESGDPGSSKASAAPAVQNVRRKEKPKKRVLDLWAMLDPHEEVGPTKPFKKGNHNTKVILYLTQNGRRVAR